MRVVRVIQKQAEGKIQQKALRLRTRTVCPGF